MRTALVTGANRGIGLETARQLGKLGLRVVVGARDAKLGKEAVSEAALDALTVILSKQSPAVKANAVCPGWVRTRMGGASAPVSAEEAAGTVVWLATLPDDGPNGKVFRKRRELDW